MVIFYEVIKWFFFMMTIVLALFLAKWTSIFPADVATQLQQILLPGYLLFCGIILGYVIAIFQVEPARHTPSQQHRIYKQGFLIGCLVGVAFALVYIFSI
jgi:formate hydrogenlyase subunit 4